MTEAKYDLLAEELITKSKWYNKEKKRSKAMAKARRNENNLSKKDEYEVEVYINKDQSKTYKITMSSKKFNGSPGDYEKIKLKCWKELEKKHEVNWINILDIVTK